MRTHFFSSFVFFSLLFLLGGASTTRAEALPATHCVTKETKALNNSKMAQMEKDIFPYLNQESTKNSIKAYRNTLETAWAAMEAPYCGYGKEGSRSAKKSYVKTVDRARIAFFAALKKPPTKNTIVTAASTVPVHSAPSLATRDIVSKGLHQGMRSDDVMELQKRLIVYFGSSASSIATGYFGPKTNDFVIRFQIEKGIISSRTADGAGLIGPKTLKALNALK